MTGLNVTDRETGKSVTIPLSSMETETGRLLEVTKKPTYSTLVYLHLTEIS